MDTAHHSWANYFQCAYKGVYGHLAATGRPAPAPGGLQVLVHGRVPTGAGVSSSAALVCASALALLGVHGITLTKGVRAGEEGAGGRRVHGEEAKHRPPSAGPPEAGRRCV